MLWRCRACPRCASLLEDGLRHLGRSPANANDDGSALRKDVVDYCMTREEREAG
jgi:hypothetical protein